MIFLCSLTVSNTWTQNDTCIQSTVFCRRYNRRVCITSSKYINILAA
jgi:hypothetical protein